MKVIYNNKEVANTTLNYNELFNKPLLNSHELVGNTSLNDIGVYSKPQVDNLIASTRSIKVVSALPTPLVANTMYYVGPDQNNLYHIYLVDSSLTLIDLGMSQDAVYIGGNGIDISSDNEISVVFDNETLMLNSEGELYVRPATENVEGVVSYDNVSIKKNSSGKIYVNNSNTIVGTTDTDKIALTKNAVQKYTDTLVKHANTGATQIPTTGGVDLNSLTYTVVGNYYVGGNFTASNIANCPTNGHAFQMTVRNPISADVGEIGNYTYRIRDIITYVNERWTQRVSRTDSGVYYSDWQRVLLADSTTDIGTEATPVWVDNGVITAGRMLYIPGPSYPSVTLPALPFVNNGGVMEIGKYIDFHTVTSSGTTPAGEDNAARIYYDDSAAPTNLLKLTNKYNNTQNGIVLTSGIMSSMPEVIEVNAVTNTTVTTWKGNTYGVNIAANGVNLTSGASGVKRVKGTLALRWTDVQNPTEIALAPVSGNDNYFKFISGLTNMGAAITPSMVTSAKSSGDWASAAFNWGTVRQSIVWYDAVRINNTTWHVDFTVSINGSQACLSGTVISNNIAADATPRIYIGVVGNPANITGILEIYR